MKKILIIGGTYFVGRVFSILASRTNEYDIHVVNRGNYKLGTPNTTEYACDRHIPERLSSLFDGQKFDAVIDFCAYTPGDIATVCDALGGRFDQYIYISTSSVCVPTSEPKTELSPVYESLPQDAPEGDYVFKKLTLEKELIEKSAEFGTKYTIIRPCFIYGPFNYAPRESYFIERIVKGQPIPTPTDATGKFSFCYVTDMANAIMTTIGHENCMNEIFNVAAPEVVDYEKLMDAFDKAADLPVIRENVTVEQVIRGNIPLPFPLDNNDLCDGSKFVKATGFTFTSLEEGMKKTYNAFKPVYAGR